MTPTELLMVRARVALLTNQPFFGDLALGLMMVEDPTLNPPTLATDGKKLFYHPDWVGAQSPDIIESGVAHEVMHKALNHLARRDGRSPGRWNVAIDHASNLILKEAGFTILNDWYCDTKFTGMSAEQIYDMLPESAGKKGGFDQHVDIKLTDEELDEIKREVIQAGESQRRHGNVPKGLERFIESINEVRADWRSVMTRFATEVAKNDFSWVRVNPRLAAYGVFMPSLYSQSLGVLAVGVDTSGSISQAVLDAFAGHLAEVKGQAQPRMTHVIYCDAAVNHVDQFDQHEDLRLEPHGGGGTDFCPVFDHITEHNIQPACCMYLTDGYGRFPEQAPGYPVLWLMTTDVQPPWGEVVRIEV